VRHVVTVSNSDRDNDVASAGIAQNMSLPFWSTGLNCRI